MWIDFDSEIPIYEQIVREIIKEIGKGTLKKGESLPSIRNLAEDIGVNLHTVNKAYAILRQKGYIKMDKRRGAEIEEDFPNFQQEEVMERKEELSYWIADALNRGLGEEVILDQVREIIDQYQGGGKSS